MRVEPRKTEGIHPHEKNPRLNDDAVDAVAASQPRESQLIDWFAEGQSVAVEFGGVVMSVHYISRKGRRARIAVTGPAGALFRGLV